MKWDEIVGKSPSETTETNQDTSVDIDALVQEVRQKTRASVVMQCGTMQVLDMTQPIGLNDVYVSVNILESITGRRRLEIADLLQGCTLENFERCGLGRITEERVPGLTAVNNYSKLIVLGKPGIGKTTFLKYLAIQCSLDDLHSHKVPIFITLKDFAEFENHPNLLLYVTHLFHPYGIVKTQIMQVLEHGRAMFLLDGLDEVREEDSYRILKQIRDLSSQFPTNQFIVTCRISGREYTFKQFTEVEVTDFDKQQIASFVTKWFATADPVKGDRFIQKLKENNPIQELANNPLLLTLLCLVFEESADFPTNRSELYKQGIDLLLKKWDGSKSTERSQIYKKLAIQQKEDLLGQIALSTFEQSDYFFKKEKIEQYIFDYIRNLHINTSAEVLQIDSNAVLKSIEAQHGLLVERAQGIYSFSHLTFQEYFAAKEIVSSFHPQILETALRQLAHRINEKRWREVFLLSVEMLRNADYLLQLMKEQIDGLVAQDEYLQAFLTWVNQKSFTVTVPYKRVAVRAFYFTLAYTLVLVSGKFELDSALASAGDTLEIAFTLDHTFTFDRTFVFDLNVDRTLILALACALDVTHVRSAYLNLGYALDPEQDHEMNLSLLRESLVPLKEQLPAPDKDKDKFEQWWQANGQAWTEQLRAIMILHRNIGHDWQFSDEQKKLLRQYCDANQLLLDCLHRDCYVTRAVREELEETLLLPSQANS